MRTEELDAIRIPRPPTGLRPVRTWLLRQQLNAFTEVVNNDEYVISLGASSANAPEATKLWACYGTCANDIAVQLQAIERTLLIAQNESAIVC